ncbi:hypothetical protein PsorP6_008453 [Peronosclerospora sorghi]|uniref:Uncharacterized protein n=1 Tax=Peronosclerospora sorghi TaxID=230839 RepID=A0ACC0WD12_9STRA|nr:hypothetical protein PsorP6_008453 [Peronosclerospora sorghi]
MDNNIGLRQRHRPSVYNPKPITAESPVTMEGLLKELYKNHPPDKLKNVSTVAKQYAGKERELAGLFKGNYGALSCHSFEEKEHEVAEGCFPLKKELETFTHERVTDLREPIAPGFLLLFGVEGSRKSVVRDTFGRRNYQFGKNGSVFA